MLGGKQFIVAPLSVINKLL